MKKSTKITIWIIIIFVCLIAVYYLAPLKDWRKHIEDIPSQWIADYRANCQIGAGEEYKEFCKEWWSKKL